MTEAASGRRSQAVPADGITPAAIKAIPVRHPWRFISAVLVVLFAATTVNQVATAPNLHWDIVFSWLLQPSILQGLVGTIILTITSMVIGIALGIVLAVMRISPNPVMSTVSWFYIWFFRGTPVLVQLFFWFNLQLVLPMVSIGIPFTPLLFQQATVKLITPFLAALLGLGLNEAAYMAEIVRAGIISVDQGQTEAAQALGMRPWQVMQRIVLPQAMRVIVPPTGNETISMLKTSSLAYVTQFGELFRASELISAYNYRIIELLIVISLWYLVLTSVLTIGQYYLERYFARGSARELPPTPWQRFRRMLFTFHSPLPAVGSSER